MIKWAQNVGHNIELDQWEQIWKTNIKLTKSVVFKDNIYKMFYKWYLIPTTLAKISTQISNICWKCKQKEGTFYHMW